MERLRPVVAAAAALLLLSGCDIIFTTSPLAFLQRDPADMSLEQRVYYAEQALASGDEGAMRDAYDAIKADAAASSDGDLQLLAGQLALGLSGINDTLDDLINIDFGAPLAANQAYINQMVAALNATYVGEAAGFYQDADANAGDLGGADYILGALAILADATVAGGGDVDTLVAADVNPAILFLTSAQTSLGPDDPSYGLVTDFLAFLGTTNFP